MDSNRLDIDTLVRDSNVCDLLLPGFPSGLNDFDVLDRYLAAGYNFVSITIGNDTFWSPDIILRRIVDFATKLCRQCEKFSIVRNADDVLSAGQAGKMAISFNLQGTNCLAGDLSLVETLSRLGVIQMLLAYNGKNAVGDGCAERTDAGLSRYGIRLISEMNRVGMIVDGTHCGHRTTMEAMDQTEAPFVFSHSNAFGVFKHYRNIKDDQVKACAATGGLVGVNGVGEFLSESGDASAETIFRHIDYIAELVGDQHVGFGLDFVTKANEFAAFAQREADQWPRNNGKPVRFDQFAPPEIIVQVAELMRRHGYGEESIRRILGQNFLRVFAAVVDASDRALPKVQ